MLTGLVKGRGFKSRSVYFQSLHSVWCVALNCYLESLMFLAGSWLRTFLPVLMGHSNVFSQLGDFLACSKHFHLFLTTSWIQQWSSFHLEPENAPSSNFWKPQCCLKSGTRNLFQGLSYISCYSFLSIATSLSTSSHFLKLACPGCLLSIHRKHEMKSEQGIMQGIHIFSPSFYKDSWIAIYFQGMKNGTLSPTLVTFIFMFFTLWVKKAFLSQTINLTILYKSVGIENMYH